MLPQSTPGLRGPDAVVVGEGKQRWTGWPVACGRADRLEQRLPFVPTSLSELSFDETEARSCLLLSSHRFR